MRRQREFADGLAEVLGTDVGQPHVTLTQLEQLTTHRHTHIMSSQTNVPTCRID